MAIRFETNVSILCDWIVWTLEIILKETQKEKEKEHDDLISSMSLSGLGKSTFRVDFGKDCSR